MSKKEKKTAAPEAEEQTVVPTEDVQPEAQVQPEEAEAPAVPDETEALRAQIADQEDKFLRLCAEYDNFRRRSKQEKDALYADATADAVKALLPVFDNLERALKQETADEAYKKGVEMTMNQLKEVFAKLGVTEIDAQGKPFDPNLHNAVMHIEDENLGENIVAQVFQAGFMLGEKVIRFAMVQVAN